MNCRHLVGGKALGKSPDDRHSAGNRGFASSGSPFTITRVIIQRPTVRLTSPQGKQVLRAGTPIPIAWKQHNAPANVRFDVYLSLDGGQSYSPLARNLPSTVQNVRWTVPNITTRRARLRVMWEEARGAAHAGEHRPLRALRLGELGDDGVEDAPEAEALVGGDGPEAAPGVAVRRRLHPLRRVAEIS